MLDLPGGSHLTNYYECSGGQTVSEPSKVASAHSSVSPSDSKQPQSTPLASDPSGNMNYFISRSSGGCATASGGYCTDTQVSETSTMKPNTGYWSDQDNVYAGLCFSSLVSYQNVPAVGTSSNNYDNYWIEGSFTYWNLCLSSSSAFNQYNILTGTNLNSGTAFETWYAVNSNGDPTKAWLTVYPPGGGNPDTYSAPIPSNPNVGVQGWEQNVVCNGGGCTTTFTAGGGMIYYYQNHMTVSSPQTTSYTKENSNCNYGSVSINQYDNLGTQSFSC
jgi:hypothetical protein